MSSELQPSSILYGQLLLSPGQNFSYATWDQLPALEKALKDLPWNLITAQTQDDETRLSVAVFYADLAHCFKLSEESGTHREEQDPDKPINAQFDCYCLWAESREIDVMIPRMPVATVRDPRHLVDDLRIADVDMNWLEALNTVAKHLQLRPRN